MYKPKMIIYKYEIKPNNYSFLLPEGSKILDVQIQNGEPYMWVLQDLNRESEMRTFCTIPTGEELVNVSGGRYEYIATFQINKMVFHLFEILWDKK